MNSRGVSEVFGELLLLGVVISFVTAWATTTWLGSLKSNPDVSFCWIVQNNTLTIVQTKGIVTSLKIVLVNESGQTCTLRYNGTGIVGSCPYASFDPSRSSLSNEFMRAGDTIVLNFSKGFYTAMLIVEKVQVDKFTFFIPTENVVY